MEQNDQEEFVSDWYVGLEWEEHLLRPSKRVQTTMLSYHEIWRGGLLDTQLRLSSYKQLSQVKILNNRPRL